MNICLTNHQETYDRKRHMITNHQGNVNSNCNSISHLSEWLMKKSTMCWWACRKKGTLMLCGWHCNCPSIQMLIHLLMQTPTSSIHGVVDVTNKFTRTAEVLWRKGTAWPLSEWESAPTLPWTGFYCFSGSIASRKVLIHYAQVCFKMWLLFTGNKEKTYWLKKKKKEKDVANAREKVVELVTLHPWEVWHKL